MVAVCGVVVSRLARWSRRGLGGLNVVFYVVPLVVFFRFFFVVVFVVVVFLGITVVFLVTVKVDTRR